MSGLRWMLALCFAVATPACGDPILHVRGVVKAAPSTCAAPASDVYASPGPIHRASIWLRCPGAEGTLLETTDARGRFDYVTAGLMSPECTVVVEQKGYSPQSFSVRDLCVATSFGLCHTISVFAELTPTDGVTAPPRGFETPASAAP